MSQTKRLAKKDSFPPAPVSSEEEEESEEDSQEEMEEEVPQGKGKGKRTKEQVAPSRSKPTAATGAEGSSRGG